MRIADRLLAKAWAGHTRFFIGEAGGVAHPRRSAIRQRRETDAGRAQAVAVAAAFTITGWCETSTAPSLKIALATKESGRAPNSHSQRRWLLDATVRIVANSPARVRERGASARVVAAIWVSAGSGRHTRIHTKTSLSGPPAQAQAASTGRDGRIRYGP
jgi:hypothetical protein